MAITAVCGLKWVVREDVARCSSRLKTVDHRIVCPATLTHSGPLAQLARAPA